MSIEPVNYQWQDFGEDVDDWNREFPQPQGVSLFSDKGWGIYLRIPSSKPEDPYYFVMSTPTISHVVTVLEGMAYPQGVEEVFYVDFLNAEGDRHPSPVLSIERSNNFLRPAPAVCGLSPDQIRRSLFMVAAYLNKQHEKKLKRRSLNLNFST